MSINDGAVEVANAAIVEDMKRQHYRSGIKQTVASDIAALNDRLQQLRKDLKNAITALQEIEQKL